MSQQRSSFEFPILPIKSGTECWQIDDQRLEAPLDYGRWLDQLREQLITAAAKHSEQTLYGATWVGPSVEFGRMGSSTWLAVTGSSALRDYAVKAIRKLLPSDFVRPGITDRSQVGWAGVLYVHEGHVWLPLDDVEWLQVDPPSKTKSAPR